MTALPTTNRPIQMASASARIQRPPAADTALSSKYQGTTSASFSVPPKMCPIFAAASRRGVSTALNQKRVSPTHQQAQELDGPRNAFRGADRDFQQRPLQFSFQFKM